MPTISSAGGGLSGVRAVEVDQLRGVTQVGLLDENVARLEVAVDDPQVVEDFQAVRGRLHEHELGAEVESGDVGGAEA